MSKERLIDRIGQFTAIPNTIIELWPQIGTDAIALFLYLCYRSDENDRAFPSYTKINKDTGLTRQRISDALKALEENGLLERVRRFSSSTVYILKIPRPETDTSQAGGLINQSPLVRQVDCISPTGGLPLVRQVDTNQTHFNQNQFNQIKDVGAKAPAPSAKPQKRGDWVDCILSFQKNAKEAADVADFPEDTRAVIQEVCKLWCLQPPAKVTRGGEFANWIKGARALREACGEFGLAVIQEIHKEWAALPANEQWTVGWPGALVKVARAKAGILRNAQSNNTDWRWRKRPDGTDEYLPEGFDTWEEFEAKRMLFRTKLQEAKQRKELENGSD